MALHDACTWMHKRGLIADWPLTAAVAAISVGLHEGQALLDLAYVEDSACDTDMNVVMTDAGGFIELQGTAEGRTFSRAELYALLGQIGRAHV